MDMDMDIEIEIYKHIHTKTITVTVLFPAIGHVGRADLFNYLPLRIPYALCPQQAPRQVVVPCLLG